MKKRSHVRKKLLVEGIIGLFIALSVLFFYFYKFIPPSEAMEEWRFMGVTFTKNGYISIQTAFYYYMTKLVPLYLMVIWFITCKHWWYHIILIPIAMYGFQLYSIFNESSKKIDENELYYLLIVCMFIIPIVYFIRLKLIDKYVHGIDLEAMEAEIRALREKQGLRSVSEKRGEARTPGTGHVYRTMMEKIDENLSTHHLEHLFRRFQKRIRHWTPFRP